jgi:hypothetical protein
MFQWLYEMPHPIYQQTKIMLLEYAKQLAHKDAWESCYFANLFAKHDDYLSEKEVLEIAANSLDVEKRYSGFRNELENIKIIAESNICLQNGNLQTSNLLLSQIQDSET